MCVIVYIDFHMKIYWLQCPYRSIVTMSDAENCRKSNTELFLIWGHSQFLVNILKCILILSKALLKINPPLNNLVVSDDFLNISWGRISQSSDKKEPEIHTYTCILWTFYIFPQPLPWKQLGDFVVDNNNATATFLLHPISLRIRSHIAICDLQWRVCCLWLIS